MSIELVPSAISPPLTVAAPTVTINAAFLREIKQDDQEFSLQLKHVQQLIQAPAARRGPNVRAIRSCQKLLDRVTRRFLLEEVYGYIRDPVSIDSQWNARVQQVYEQHALLFRQLVGLVGHAEYILSDVACHRFWPQFLNQVQDYCSRLEDHERREIELLNAGLHLQMCEGIG